MATGQPQAGIRGRRKLLRLRQLAGGAPRAAGDQPAVLRDGSAVLIRQISEDDAALLADHIRERFRVEAVVMGSQLRIERNEGHRFVPDLVEAFPGEIQAISVSKPALEDVFIHRTGHKFWSEEREAAASLEKEKKQKKKRR